MDQQSTGSMSEATATAASAEHVHVRYEGRKARFLPYLSPVALVRDLWRHRALLHQLSKSQFSAGHREDFLGKGWLVLEPLALLLVYSVVFLVIFGLNLEKPPPLRSVLSLYAGIVTYQMFAQALGTSANVIRGAHGYVKLMVFPTQVLPGSIVGGLIVPGFIGYALVLVVAVIGGLPITPRVLLLPVALIPMYLIMLGLAWILGALCVFIPDMRTVTAIGIRFGFFLTPIVYPLDRVHGPLRTLLMLNPLTAVVESARGVLLRDHPPDWTYLGIVTAASLVLCQIAYAFFMRSKRWFADVL